MAQAYADRNLLFGVVALQFNFITREALVAAVTAWLRDKSRPLDQVMLEHGMLTPPNHRAIEGLVVNCLDQNAGDPAQSLAAQRPIGSLRAELEKLDDAELMASLNCLPVGPEPAADPYATRDHAGGRHATLGHRYELLGKHASGGLGDVWRALDSELDREVAVKQIKTQYAHVSEHRTRFVREARITGKLEHPGIVPLYSAGETAHGQPFYAMRFIRGESLLEAIARFHQKDASRSARSERPLALRKLLGRFIDACDAIAYAHSRGFVHRDIKPANIMLGPFGETLVVDWGLAKSSGPDPTLDGLPVSDTGTGTESNGAALTQMDSTLGTPHYMSPEQAHRKHDEVGPASDIYSLGATLYHLLAGCPPFEGQNPGEVITRVASYDFKPPSAHNAGVPPALEAICLKAMAREPSDRYGTPRELAEDIERWLADGKVSVYREPPAARLGRWWRRHPRIVAVAFSLIFIGMVAAFLEAQARTRDRYRRSQQASREREAESRRQAEAARLQSEAEKRQSDMQTMQRLRMAVHFDGWSERTLQLVREAASGERNLALRNQAAATLIGTDARKEQNLPNDGTTALQFDREGKRLLVGGLGLGSVPHPTGVWDVKSRRFKPSPLVGHGPVAFAPDGTELQLVAVGNTQDLLFSDPAVLFRELLFPEDLPRGHLTLCDLTHSRILHRFSLPVGDRLRSVTMMADGSLVAASTVRRDVGTACVFLWDARTGQPAGELRSLTGAYGELAFSPDGSLLAGGDELGHVDVWSVPDRRRVARFTAGRLAVTALAFGRNVRSRQVESVTPQRRWVLAVSDEGGMAGVWDVASQRRLALFLGSHHQVLSVAFSPDGMTLATAGRSAKLWDLATGRLLLSLRASDYTGSLCFTPDGRKLALGGASTAGPCPVQIWDLDLGRGAERLRGLETLISRIAISKDARLVAALSHDWQIAIWDRQSGKLLHVLDAPAGITADNAGLCFSHDNKRFALAAGEEARMWDVQSGRLLRAWTLPPGKVDVLTFRPSGRLYLCRVETRSGKAAPTAGSSPLIDPRVVRIRELRDTDSGGAIRLVAADPWFNLDLSAAAAPADGRFVDVEGFVSRDGRFTEESISLAIRAYDTETGRILWTYPHDLPHHVPGTDPDGSVVFSYDKKTDSTQFLDAATGAVRPGRVEGTIAALGPGGALYAKTPANDELGHTYGLLLKRTDGDQTLLHLDMDFSSEGVTLTPIFSLDGRYLVQGRVDGSVIVYDIPEVRRRLGDVGLDW